MKRGKRYSADFKAKTVLELLSGDKPLNQLCSTYGLVPKTVLGWKETFLANASLAFNNQLPRRKQRGMYKISLSSAQVGSVGA